MPVRNIQLVRALEPPLPRRMDPWIPRMSHGRSAGAPRRSPRSAAWNVARCVTPFACRRVFRARGARLLGLPQRNCRLRGSEDPGTETLLGPCTGQRAQSPHVTGLSSPRGRALGWPSPWSGLACRLAEPRTGNACAPGGKSPRGSSARSCAILTLPRMPRDRDRQPSRRICRGAPRRAPRAGGPAAFPREPCALRAPREILMMLLNM